MGELTTAAVTRPGSSRLHRMSRHAPKRLRNIVPGFLQDDFRQSRVAVRDRCAPDIAAAPIWHEAIGMHIPGKRAVTPETDHGQFNVKMPYFGINIIITESYMVGAAAGGIASTKVSLQITLEQGNGRRGNCSGDFLHLQASSGELGIDCKGKAFDTDFVVQFCSNH